MQKSYFEINVTFPLFPEKIDDLQVNSHTSQVTSTHSFWKLKIINLHFHFKTWENGSLLRFRIPVQINDFETPTELYLAVLKSMNRDKHVSHGSREHNVIGHTAQNLIF